MALFDDVFNKTALYNMLFFNVKSVLLHPTVEDLEANNKSMYERWKYVSKTKYSCEVFDIKSIDVDGATADEMDFKQNNVYQEHAVYHPEFCKIIAFSHGTPYCENNMVNRKLQKFASMDESLVLSKLMDVFNSPSNQPSKSNTILCGHNITVYDIPLIIKRYILLNRKSESSVERKQLPLILKKCLTTKPWESGLVDTVNVWKFNGIDSASLMLISDFLQLKRGEVDLLPLNELSKYYWDNINNEQQKVLDFIALQSATQTNLVIQLMTELRQY